MPKCDFNKVSLEFYGYHALVWMFFCKFAAYFQNTFLEEHLLMATSVYFYFSNVKTIFNLPQIFLQHTSSM